MNLKALMALRANKVAEMQSLLDGATAENRELTAEETARYDNLMSEQNKLKDQISRVEAQEKLNQYLLEISMDWFKNGNGDVVWKIYKEQGQIIIKPAPAKKKDLR